MKHLVLGFCALAVIGLTGCAATDPIDNNYGPFQEWDVDRDGNLEDAEFSQRIAERDYYGDWDQNEDGVINENEFEAGVFYSYAGDNDVIDNTEFSEASGAWYADADDAGTFGDWDANDDDMIDSNEFEEGIATYPVYGDWDVDGDDRLTDDEYADGVYDVWDLDNDGNVNQVEFERGYDSLYYVP